MSPTLMKVVVIDESPIAVLGATTILVRAGINVIGTSTRLEQLHSLLAAHTCELALIEPFALGVPVEESLRCLAVAMAAYPSVAITALTHLGDPRVTGTLMDMGVRGVVDKRAPWTDIPAAIYATASGGSFRRPAGDFDAGRRLQRKMPRTTSTS